MAAAHRAALRKSGRYRPIHVINMFQLVAHFSIVKSLLEVEVANAKARRRSELCRPFDFMFAMNRASPSNVYVSLL